MSRALITPPLPEELWYRIREIQTRKVDCEVIVTFYGGRVHDWTVTIHETPDSGRQDIRLQKAKDHYPAYPASLDSGSDIRTNKKDQAG